MQKRRLRGIAIGILLIAVFSIVGLEYFRPTSKDDAVYEGPPVYIASMFADDDQLWLLRAKRLGIPHEYELYKLGDNGRQEYVCPYEGTAPFWNQCSGKAYFLALSGQSIGEFDPAAKETQYYSLKRQYIHICGADGDAVFLQQELYGKVYMYSLYGSEERELETSGWELEACRGYLIMWDPFILCLNC